MCNTVPIQVWGRRILCAFLHHQLRDEPSWRDKARLTLVLVYARHFLATEPAAGPLTVDRRVRLVTVHSFSGVLPLFDASSDPQVCRAAGTVRHLDQVSSGIYSRVLAALAAALVGAYVALAVLLARAVLRVVRPRLDGHR